MPSGLGRSLTLPRNTRYLGMSCQSRKSKSLRDTYHAKSHTLTSPNGLLEQDLLAMFPSTAILMASDQPYRVFDFPNP